MIGDPKDSNCTWGQFIWHVITPILVGIWLGTLLIGWLETL